MTIYTHGLISIRLLSLDVDSHRYRQKTIYHDLEQLDSISSSHPGACEVFQSMIIVRRTSGAQVH